MFLYISTLVCQNEKNTKKWIVVTKYLKAVKSSFYIKLLFVYKKKRKRV